ncbi:MAG: hypothetical protein NTZ14_12980 [Hyphomicrobiales bacterium]|nr:hypothetical protein [Hyphomicrobiales bacterium]
MTLMDGVHPQDVVAELVAVGSSAPHAKVPIVTTFVDDGVVEDADFIFAETLLFQRHLRL